MKFAFRIPNCEIPLQKQNNNFKNVKIEYSPQRD